MRVAIQLYGHLRTFRYTNKSLFEYLIKPALRHGVAVDIFIHTWDEFDAVQKTGHYRKVKKYQGCKISDKDKRYVKNIYQPTSLLIEPQLSLTEEDKQLIKSKNLQTDIYTAMKNVSYSLGKVNKMRREYMEKNNINYDYIITTRADILFKKKLPLDKVSVEQNSIVTSYISSYTYGEVRNTNKHILGVDLLMFAVPQIMDLLTVWHDDFKNYCHLYPEDAISLIMYQNKICHQHIVYEKDRCWQILRLNWSYTYSILWKPVRILTNVLFFMLQPLLLLSPKYRSSILLNPHWLEKAKIKNYFKIIK